MRRGGANRHPNREGRRGVGPDRVNTELDSVRTEAIYFTPMTSINTQGQLDAVAIRLLEEKEVPGLVLGLRLPSGERLLSAAGVSDVERRVPMSVETPLRIGSISKTFTAAAVVVLASRGRLDLDDPAVLYLPELAGIESRGHRVEDITLRRLLLHRSGILSEPPTRDWWGEQPFPSSAEILEKIDLVAIAIPPGSAFKYSNLGYALLGEIVSRISATSFEDFIHQTLLAPAGMLQTGFEAPDPAPGGYGRASDEIWPRQRPQEFGGERSAGGMWATAGDLLRWTEVASGGVPRALAPQQAELLRSRQPEPGPMGSLGWSLWEGDARTLCGFGGGVNGFTCQLEFDPDRGEAAAVLTNGHMTGAEWAKTQLAGLLGVAVEDREMPIVPSAPSPTDPTGTYVGVLDVPAFISVAADGSLRLGSPISDPDSLVVLRPTREPDRFLVKRGRFAGERLELLRDDSGAVNAFAVSAWTFRKCP